LSKEHDLAGLREDCRLGTKFWSIVFSTLTTMTFREKGEDTTLRLWKNTLSGHQGDHYIEGLRKLGIGENEPPAVIAAKYHYLTNKLAGLDMEYIEESPKKVWVRYLAPMWTYPGNALVAMPAAVRR